MLSRPLVGFSGNTMIGDHQRKQVAVDDELKWPGIINRLEVWWLNMAGLLNRGLSCQQKFASLILLVRDSQLLQMAADHRRQ